VTIEKMIEATIGKEGRYVNNPADPGGATCWGITERVARAHGYTGRMADLPRERAVAIYREQYAIRPGFAAVAQINPAIGEELFDTGVNMGPSVPAMWLQQCLNALNNGGRLYGDIREDGDIGPGTLGALKAYLKARGAEAESVMLKVLNGLQAAHYVDIARRRAASEAFLYGWLRTRVGL
jgi:lysozyme family protein